MRTLCKSFRRCAFGVLPALCLLSWGMASPSLAQTAEQFRQKAVALSQAKSWDEAIATYHKALELEPNDPLTHYNLALALTYKGEPRQAKEEFEATLGLNPNFADAHYGLAATCFELKD